MGISGTGPSVIKALDILQAWLKLMSSGRYVTTYLKSFISTPSVERVLLVMLRTQILRTNDDEAELVPDVEMPPRVNDGIDEAGGALTPEEQERLILAAQSTWLIA